MTIKKLHWSTKLKSLDACREAVEWCNGQKSARDAWKNCKRGDWLLWIVSKTTRAKYGSKEHRQIVRAACAISRTVLRYVQAGEDRPRLAIEAAEAWAQNPTSAARSATMNAANAAMDAAMSVAMDAANAAMSVAMSVAMDAANAAMNAADATRIAIMSAATSAARSNSADIVRSMIKMPKLGGVK